MKMRKILCAVLAVFMLCGMLTACGGGEQTSSDGITLKWYVPEEKQADSATVMAKVNEYLQEKLGVSLELMFIDTGAFQERMNMNMASGDDYDLAFVGYLNNYVNAAEKDGLMEITDLLELTPDLKAAIPDYIWEDASINGELYAVPNQQIMALPTALFVSKKLADEYGLDTASIKATTDIEPFLAWVKEKYPLMYPFRTNWGVASFRAFDEENSNNGQQLIASYYDKEQQKMIVADGQEYGNTFDKAAILNDWYKKGYIRKDVESVVDDLSDLKAGKYAVYVAGWKPGGEAEAQKNYGYEVIGIPVADAMRSVGASRSTMIGIGRNSKHPEEAIKLIELMNTDKYLYNLICYGIEGKHYNKTGENRIELIPGSGYVIQGSWKFGSQFNSYILPGQPDNVWEETARINNEAKMAPTIPGYKFDNTDYKALETKLNSVKDSYTTIDCGTQHPSEYWEDYMAELYASGLQDYIDAQQKQLDDYIAANPEIWEKYKADMAAQQ